MTALTLPIVHLESINPTKTNTAETELHVSSLCLPGILTALSLRSSNTKIRLYHNRVRTHFPSSDFAPMQGITCAEEEQLHPP